MKNNEINMGSSIIDLYMDGYDEGKHDEIESRVTRTSDKKTKSNKVRTSARRKKAYYKSKNRMMQLSSVAHYEPSPEDKQVVLGMLRDHQYPMDERKCENPCGTSIGNKRRSDTADQKMREALVENGNETVVMSHGSINVDDTFESHGFMHNPA